MHLSKKIILLVLVSTLITSLLTGCVFVNDRHRTRKEAKAIAKELTGEEVTYVETVEDEKNKEIIYVFKDSRGNEFAIISTLVQNNFDGASYGPYYCHVKNTYTAGVFVSNREAVMEILRAYDLDGYLSNTRAFDEDIYAGEGVVSSAIDIDITSGTYDENEDILKRVAAAGTEIDALLSLNYNGENMDKSHKGGFYYKIYGSYTGIRLSFKETKVNAQGSSYTNSDIAYFKCSVSDDERWTQEKLYEHLRSQLEDVVKK